MTFQFINADGSSVTSSFSFQPIIYPLTNGSYRVLADVINSSVAPATFSLVDNIYKVENNGESSNDWYINQSGSVISGSTSSGSLVNVTFNLENSNGISNLPIYFSLIPINKNIGFIDVSGSKFLVTGNRIDCVTDLTGSLTIPLVPNQPYKIKYVGKIKNCIDRILPTTDSNVNDCIVQSSMVSQTITPQNNSLYSYTAAASDLRYQSASYAISASYAPSQFIDTSSLVNNTTFNSYTSSNDAAINSLINVTSSYITNSQTSSMTVASSSFAISSSYSPVQIPNIQMFGNDVAINQNSRGGTYIGNPYGQLAISATPAIYFNVNSHLATTITEDGIVVAGDISCNNITASILGTSSWSNNSITASSITAANNTVLGYLNDVRSNIQTQLDQLNGNAGLTSVPTITNNNDGTITITSASVNLYDNPYGTGVITSYNIPQTTLALNPYLLNIVIAELSGGNAIYNITSNQTDVNDLNIIPVSGIEVVGVDGLGWHYVEFDFGATGLALPNKLALKDVSLNGNQRQSGLLLSAGSGTDFSISAGATWYSVNQTSFDVFDSYNYPTCITSYLVQSASVWSSSYGVGYINDYYNGPSGLTPLAPNSCSVNYIYKILANNINGAIVVVGGQYDTLLNAQSAPVPILPTSTADFALLTGRIIVQSGSTSPTVQSAYTTQFGAATVTTHNDLLGIQGGQGGEYYHLTQAEYLGNGAGAFVRQSGTVATSSVALTVSPSFINVPNGIAGLDSNGNLNATIIPRQNTYANLSSVVLLSGQEAYTTDTRKVYFGNGTSSVSNLFPYPVSGSTFTSPTLSASNVVVNNNIQLGGYLVNSGSTPNSSNIVGELAGNSATNANYSNFFGYNAGYYAAYANNSNFFGNSAGVQATSAQYSNFFGYQAGYYATNANNSNFFGNQAGMQATNANNSNFFGYSAGMQATYVNNSNFFGYSAGMQATNANYSNFFGYSAGMQATNANYSNFFGYQAGYYATYANKSIFIGFNAGATATNANNSIFIGYSAGGLDTVNNKIVTGSSILIGDYTNTGGYPNSIAIGRGTKNFAAASLNIGNVIYATNIYSGSSTTATSASNSIGKVGIGTYNPVNALDVVGNISCSVITASLLIGTSSYSLSSSAANSITFIPNLSNTASYTTREIAGIIPNTSFGGTPLTSSVTGLGLSNTNYAIGITGVDAKSWTYYNKTTGGFTISSNSATAMTGEVSWTVIKL
jgi:hypothetical protein